MPVGVTYSANTFITEDWINPLRGYACDSFNPDALALMKVTDDGQIELPSGMKYKALIVPGKHPMQPNPEAMTSATRSHLQRLAGQGAKFIKIPCTQETPDGIEPDFTATDANGQHAGQIAYTHRQNGQTDIYFVSNQSEQMCEIMVSLRTAGKIPELWYPANGTIRRAKNWIIKERRTCLPLRLDARESIFIVLKEAAGQTTEDKGKNWSDYREIIPLDSAWTVQFDPKERGPEQAVLFEKLLEWNKHPDNRIRYYSGTAVYSKIFNWNLKNNSEIFIELENIYNIASVKINGSDCGTVWTRPYRLNISGALKQGCNTVEITVSNTWANRIAGDEDFDAEQNEPNKIWTNARYRLPDKQLVPSGLSGYIRIVEEL
jgi:hypothetical protein